MQVIGIIGDDHCGSTVLARALAALPGVESGGELHWLADLHPGHVHTVRAGWSVTRDCAVHGINCPVFNRAFLQRGFTGETLYSAVCAQMVAADEKAKYLVSTDKYPGFYKKYTKPKEMLGIVFYKPPVLAYYSQTRTNKRERSKALETWCNIYSEALHWAEKFCLRVAWLDYTTFALQPQEVFTKLVEVLKLETRVPEKIKMTSDYHFIGGNKKVLQSKLITLDSSYANLERNEMTKIYALPRVKDIMTALIQRSHAQELMPLV